ASEPVSVVSYSTATPSSNTGSATRTVLRGASPARCEEWADSCGNGLGIPMSDRAPLWLAARRYEKRQGRGHLVLMSQNRWQGAVAVRRTHRRRTNDARMIAFFEPKIWQRGRCTAIVRLLGHKSKRGALLTTMLRDCHEPFSARSIACS